MILGTASTTPHQDDTFGVSGINGTTFASGAYSASTAINTTKVLRSFYPRFDDNDADNTGGATDQVTWSVFMGYSRLFHFWQHQYFRWCDSRSCWKCNTSKFSKTFMSF